MRKISFFLCTLLCVSTNAYAQWSSPVLIGRATWAYGYDRYWDINNTVPKSKMVLTNTKESGYIMVYRSLRVWSNPENSVSIEESFYNGGEVWRNTTEWPNNVPPARDFSAHIFGRVTTGGAGYYDYINNQNGYAEAEGRADIGTIIIGQNPNGTTYSNDNSSQAISATKITAYDGDPPLAEFTPKPSYENPDVNHQFFDDPISTCSGYFKRWTIYWQYAGFHPTCKAKGCDNVGGRVKPSTAFAELYFYFTP